MLARTLLLALMAVGSCSAFAPASLPLATPRARAGTCSVRMQQKEIDLLDKVEQLQLLTAVSKSGLLSKLEKDKTLSKLEEAGALSKLEELLPIADQIGAISLAKKAANIPPGTLKLGAFALAAAEAGLIFAVPDDSTPLIALQVASAVAVVAGMAPLLIGAQLLEIVQGDKPVELPKF